MFPTAKCRLRLLKLERIKDFLLLEKEYIRNQEVFKVRGNIVILHLSDICTVRVILPAAHDYFPLEVD